MADIKRIVTPNGESYDISDPNALHLSAGANEKLTGDLYLNKASGDTVLNLQANGVNKGGMYYSSANGFTGIVGKTSAGSSIVSGSRFYDTGQVILFGTNNTIYIRPKGVGDNTNEINVSATSGTTVRGGLGVLGSISATGNGTVSGNLSVGGTVTRTIPYKSDTIAARTIGATNEKISTLTGFTAGRWLLSTYIRYFDFSNTNGAEAYVNLYKGADASAGEIVYSYHYVKAGRTNVFFVDTTWFTATNNQSISLYFEPEFAGKCYGYFEAIKI